MRQQIIRKIILSITGLTLISAFNTSFAADGSTGASSASNRTGKLEWSFSGNYLNSKSIEFGGGSKADINGDLGWIFGLGYNYSEKLARDFQMGWNSASYSGTRVEQGTGNKDTYGGRLDTSSLRFGLTYNFMPKRLTPYITGNIGWTWIDTNIPSVPPSLGCWLDPYYGQLCSRYQPTYASTEFTYGTALGLRYDVHDSLFLRGSLGKQWLDISKANGTPDFTTYRFEIGYMF